MDRTTQNQKMYDLLKKIRDNSDDLIDKGISEQEENFYNYLINQGFVTNLNIENYYSGPMINAEYAFITEKGYTFLDDFEQDIKPIRMTKKNRYIQLQVLLKRIEEKQNDLRSPNFKVYDEDYLDLLQFAIENSYIKGISLAITNGKLYAVVGTPRITPEGYEVLKTPFEQIQPSQQVLIQTFNFHDGDFRNSVFGTDNTQNNKE